MRLVQLLLDLLSVVLLLGGVALLTYLLGRPRRK
jgi:hypothetical protein